MQAFVALLERERGELHAGKADALPALATEKADLLEILSHSARVRARLLGEAGLPASADGVERLLETDAGARGSWNGLLEVARRAEALNAANSRLVSLQMARVDRALGALGAAAGDFYGTDGLSAQRRPAASRSLATG